MCGQNAEFLNGPVVSMCNYHCALYS